MNNPVCPIDYRYGRKELKEIFGETRRLQYLLDVEAALTRAHAKIGNIPKSASDEISKKASIKYVKVERVNKIEAETKHDIMAITRALAEQCSGDAGKYIHLGATSYDIVDTANALQFADSTEFVRKGLRELRNTFVGLAKKHKKTVMVGRTHGQHTIPITFGLKMAGYAMEVERHLKQKNRLAHQQCLIREILLPVNKSVVFQELFVVLQPLPMKMQFSGMNATSATLHLSVL